MITTMYRIFDDKNDLPHTLFHGLNGKRQLELDTWLEAEVKAGRDGSGQKKKLYQTGFHCLTDLASVVKFLGRFRNLKGRVVCAVHADESFGVWRKEHSPAKNLRLVRRMRVTKAQWEERIPLEELVNA